MVKPYGKGSDPRCIKEANEDITALRRPIGSPRVMALTGLFFLVVFLLLLGLLLIYARLSEKNDAIGGAWMLTGLITALLGVFFLLLGKFWRGEKLRKNIEKDARARDRF